MAECISDGVGVVPRRVMVLADPGSWYWQDLRLAARCWNQNILRADLTPCQRSLAWLIGQDTLARGFPFCIYDALEDLVSEVKGASPVFGISRGNLMEGLCGFATSGEREVSRRRAAGLEGLGLVRVERMHLEGRLRWGVSVCPDARGWSCGMVRVERLAERRAALDGLLRGFAPHLAGEGFGPVAGLYDALSATSFEGPMDDVEGVKVDALRVAAGKERPFGRPATVPVASTDGDALSVGCLTDEGAGASRRSGCRNVILQGKRGVVPTVGTRPYNTRARASGQSDSGQGQGQNTGQNSAPARAGDRSRRDVLKGLIQGGERDFYQAAREVIGASDWEDRSSGHAPNGVRWMRRWQAGGEHRAKAVGVFAEILGGDFVVRTTAARAAECVWKQFGGAALDAERLAGKIWGPSI